MDEDDRKIIYGSSKRVRAILVIVIDCLRADHVSCYGYSRATTPTIDRLAGRGHLWEQAHSVSCWTRPSVASIFTGLYPTQHGAFEYIKRDRNTGTTTTDVLRSTRPTLAEMFVRNGWRCGAFMRNEQLGEYTRLNRGFESYDPAAGKARELMGSYCDWLQEDLAVPSFGYLHLVEAHWPYRAREQHLNLFGTSKVDNDFRDFTGVEYGKLKRALSGGEQTLSPSQVAQMVDMYDACVRRVDEEVDHLLDRLTELGIRDDTAIVITADHGEEFTEHGGIGHGQGLFDELLRVPLVIAVPGQREPVRHPHPVSQIDLADTLLKLGGIDDNLDGGNLFTAADSDRPIFAERRKRKRYSQIIRKGRWKYHRRYKFKIPSEQFDPGMTTQQMLGRFRHKIVRELYDLTSDPDERNDLAEDPALGDVREGLESELDRWWEDVTASVPTDPTDQVEIDPRVVQRLQDLGYLE